jgi:polyisoprenoid-binding protein YceI
VTRSRSFALVLIAAVAVVVGGYLAYDNVLRGDSVAPLTLPSAAAPAAAPTTADASVDPSASEPTSSVAAASGAAGGVAGTWTITSGEAGYRVRERLANLPAESDAVGRTKDVTGSITLTGSGDAVQLTAATVQVNTTTIASDESRRDNRMRSEGLQTDQYQTASFTLTKPVAIPPSAGAGTATNVTLTGDLTLHGVTKTVDIPAQAQLVNGTISVAGSLSFPLSDFNISAPNIGGFILSIADTGTLEFTVNLTKG